MKANNYLKDIYLQNITTIRFHLSQTVMINPTLTITPNIVANNVSSIHRSLRISRDKKLLHAAESEY